MYRFLLLLSASALFAATPAELMDRYITGLNDVTRNLEPVKDPAAAKAIVPRLNEAIAKVEAVRLELKAANLSLANPEHKAALDQKAPQLQEAMARLHNELTRVKGMRSVRAELHASLRLLKEAGELENLP
jgi:hypothetical protein